MRRRDRDGYATSMYNKGSKPSDDDENIRQNGESFDENGRKSKTKKRPRDEERKRTKTYGH